MQQMSRTNHKLLLDGIPEPGSAWIRLGLALPQSGCTSRRFRSPREGGELCGGARNVAVEQGVVFSLSENVSVFWSGV